MQDLLQIPCSGYALGYNFEMNTFSPRNAGRELMLPGFQKRMARIIECASLALAGLFKTRGNSFTSVHYILGSQSVFLWGPENRDKWYIPQPLSNPVCYDLGIWPIYWDKHNKIPVYPDHMDPMRVVEMHDTPILRGGAMTDYEQAILDEIKDTQDIDTIRNMLNVDGNYDRDLLLSQGRDVYQIEALSRAMDGLTMFRKAEAIQDYFLMDWTVEQWRNAHQKCINDNYPKEAKPIKPRYVAKPPVPKKEPSTLKGVNLPTPERLGAWPKNETETVLELDLEFWVMSTETQETYLTSMDIHEKQKLF